MPKQRRLDTLRIRGLLDQGFQHGTCVIRVIETYEHVTINDEDWHPRARCPHFGGADQFVASGRDVAPGSFPAVRGAGSTARWRPIPLRAALMIIARATGKSWVRSISLLRSAIAVPFRYLARMNCQSASNTFH